MWAFTIITFLLLGTLAFRGARWAYFTFVLLGLFFFPARVGFQLHPTPCECALTVPLALFSLTNYKHIVLFVIFFLMTSVQLRDSRPGTQILASSAAVLAMSVYVELAQAVTGQGHCRLRDLVPDLFAAVAGAALLLVLRKLRWPAFLGTGDAGKTG